MKGLFVLTASALLINGKPSNGPSGNHIKETSLVLGADEAYNFLTDVDSIQAQKVTQEFAEAAKQGREERLNLFPIMQDPQNIADPVFKQVNTKVVPSLDDGDVIRSANIPLNFKDKVSCTEKGQIVVYSPDGSDPVELTGLSICMTRRGS